MISRTVFALTMAGALVLSGGALAAIDAAQVIKTRQDNLKTLGKAFKAIHDEIGKGAQDKALLAQSAETIDKLAGDFATWFPEGSGPEAAVKAGIKTGAKPEIWTRPADFTKAVQDLSAQTKLLAVAARSGDKDAIGKTFKDTGSACGACHKEFRAKDAD